MAYNNPYLDDPYQREGRGGRGAREQAQVHQPGRTPRPRHSLPRPVSVLLRALLLVLGIFLGVVLYLTIWIRQAQVHVPVLADYEQRVKVASTPVATPDQDGRVPLYIDERYPIEKHAQRSRSVKNVLLFGVDARGPEDMASRADTILLASFDKKTNEVRLTSILRDTQVYIEDYGYQKINAAYAYGGAGLLLNTINDNFDLDVQNFVMLDFWTSVAVVDAVGGVEIEVTEAELQPLVATVDEMNRLVDPEHPSPFIETAGTHLMDGKQAIGWARIRASDSDIQRTGRQRVVLEKVMNKFLSLNIFDKMAFANRMMSELKFNFDALEIVDLATQSLDVETIKEQAIPLEGHYYTDYSNWNIVPNLDLLIPQLHEYIWPYN